MSHDEETDLVFNGVNASTGEPLMPPLSIARVASLAQGESWDPEHLSELASWNELVQENHMDVGFGIDHRRLDETGWGVIFAHDCDAAVRDALQLAVVVLVLAGGLLAPELEQRPQYRPGESKLRFLARHKVGPGPVNPEVLPYYLLIVGDPEKIPFSFQYQLDLQYAVGRIHFATAEEYAAYAASVVAAEKGEVSRTRKAAFLAVTNPDDRSTRRCRHSLAEPLAGRLESRFGDWAFSRTFEGVTKSALGEALAADGRPAVVFTTSHGVGFSRDDPRQLRHQGALLCQEWPGPRQWRRSIPEEHYFSADDVADGASPAGLVAFCFACYGAGTPRRDSFAHRDPRRGQIAPHDFVAGLPRRLLGHPRGGALAVIGHVDRAWSYCFDWPQAEEQLEVFESAFGRLFDGYPVGAAMEYFNQRYAELSADLTFQIEEAKYAPGEADLVSLSGMWTANNDARSYVVIGDPAVRLAVARE